MGRPGSVGLGSFGRPGHPTAGLKVPGPAGGCWSGVRFALQPAPDAGGDEQDQPDDGEPDEAFNDEADDGQDEPDDQKADDDSHGPTLGRQISPALISSRVLHFCGWIVPRQHEYHRTNLPVLLTGFWKS